MGVGSVVLSALYSPLAEKDYEEVSLTLSAAKNYFQKLAYSLVIYAIILIIFYLKYLLISYINLEFSFINDRYNFLPEKLKS